MRPLEGMKVLDFTQFTSGPVCTYILAEFGADVYKLENPPYGDNNHYAAPAKNKHSVYITTLNHAKKSVLMNMKNPDHKALFMKMVETADLVIDNFKAGTLEKFGITYEVLKEVNPKVVWTSVSGYGQTGPWSKRTAYDMTIQAVSGIVSVNGEKGGTPVKAGISMSDFTSGLYAACGTVSALIEAQKTGKGRRIDMAMVDASFSLCEQFVARYYLTGEVMEPMGREHLNFVPYNSYTCKDGKDMLICVRNDAQFADLCQILGCPEYAVNEKYMHNADRLEHRDEVNNLMEEAVSRFDYKELWEMLQKNHIPCGTINNVETVTKLEQTAARNMLVTTQYTDGTTCGISGCPIKMSGVEDITQFHTSTLGEDTIQVLSQYAEESYIHELYDAVLKDSAEKWAERAARLN